MFVCVWINIYSYIRSSIRWIRLVEAHPNWTEIVIPSEVFSYTYLCTPGYVCWFFSLPRVSFRPLFRCHCFRMEIHMLVWSMHPKLGQTACLLLNIFFLYIHAHDIFSSFLYGSLVASKMARVFKCVDERKKNGFNLNVRHVYKCKIWMIRLVFFYLYIFWHAEHWLELTVSTLQTEI